MRIRDVVGKKVASLVRRKFSHPGRHLCAATELREIVLDDGSRIVLEARHAGDRAWVCASLEPAREDA